MDKPQLIRLIHVAKGKLKLDDETYCLLLSNTANGKSSCSKMSHGELLNVYSELQQRGFKRSFKRVQCGLNPIQRENHALRRLLKSAPSGAPCFVTVSSAATANWR